MLPHPPVQPIKPIKLFLQSFIPAFPSTGSLPMFPRVTLTDQEIPQNKKTNG